MNTAEVVAIADRLDRWGVPPFSSVEIVTAEIAAMLTGRPVPFPEEEIAAAVAYRETVELDRMYFQDWTGQDS